MSTHCDGKTGWPITDASACQHPDAIFCPPLEFIQHEWRGVEGDHSGLRVRTPTLHDLQLVVHDATIAALCRWWIPRYPDWCWTHCFPSHVLGGCPGHYSWGGRDTTHFNTTQVTYPNTVSTPQVRPNLTTAQMQLFLKDDKFESHFTKSVISYCKYSKWWQEHDKPVKWTNKRLVMMTKRQTYKLPNSSIKNEDIML